MLHQPGILEPIPTAGRHLTFDLRWRGDPREGLMRLVQAASPTCVIGLGLSLVSTQNALWIWIREQLVSDAFDQARLL